MLLSHRLADFAANPVSLTGGVYTYVGFDSSITFPSGTQAGDIVVYGFRSTVGGTANPTVGFTQLHRVTQGSSTTALYAKALTSTDIARGTTGNNPEFLSSQWNFAIRGTNPFTSFSTRGQTTSSGDSGAPSLTMSSTTQNPGMVLAYYFNGYNTNNFTITNAESSVTQISTGNINQGQQHKIAFELTNPSNTTTARTSSSMPWGETRAYTETILCLNGIE
jgi:hypothetical protein